ncbi:MAG: 1-acyl-sn-glycerol-3-phosphate acyltransferase [Phycisphaeraceae bacterium]|nr:1-acyl-sn-glycerol-3-phosphate acyltransferase [Phycisphaeraceae bacterium]MCW5767600.1 1-acyl-sn-glycerol-3-phosphate acyltransferase [Phycisphaeraceae bacterium]
MGHSPHDDTRSIHYRLAVVLLQVVLAALFGYRRYGISRVPRTGPLLVVSNHQSYLDSVAVGTALYPRVATHLARAGLFKRRGFAHLITKFHAVPLREEEGDLGAMRLVIERLKLGDAVIIYPEGSRTHDGAIHAFKRGATLIAKRSGCTVLPVAIDGGFDIWPRSRALPRLFRGPLRVLIGEPIAASDLLAEGADAGLVRLENEVRRLHGRLIRG